jgi:succinate dehydrogenase/fumarate reductase flavoprotein subunit
MQRVWDKETDVLIAGYGLAGAVAAIEARDSGAKVTILEKSQYPGGCSILSAGMILCARDVKEATSYLTHTSGGRVDDSLILAFAQNLVGNEPYLEKLAQADEAKINNTRAAEPGKEGDLGYIPAGYPFPGYKTFYRAAVQEIPGFKGFPWVQRLRPAGVNLMKLVMDNVEKRGIEVLFSTPAKTLVTDASGTIIGATAETAEKHEVVIKARHAVILACGGFEHNRWLQEQYLQGKPFCSMAPLTHTGDGILMAQKVGAALWHMWHVHGSYGFKFPEFPIAFRHRFTGPRNTRQIMPWVLVDKLGRRYQNECQPAPQDTGHRAMEIFDPDIVTYPRIPSYIVFDEEGRKHGPIAKPLAIGQHMYEWSKDNLQEVAKGWVLKEDTIEKLAFRIRDSEDDEGRMTSEILKATIAEWNIIVSNGNDPFRRPPGTMAPIKTAPFYAVPVWPLITTTQGGPQHNARQQVLDPSGEPVPHLYAAGELGSFWSHLYRLGGNLGECLCAGRVAGKHAAEESAV